MRKPIKHPVARYWHSVLFGGTLGWLIMHGRQTWPWVSVLGAVVVGCAWECYCASHSDPRGGCPRPVPPPLIRVDDPEFEMEARLGSAMPPGHPEWLSGLVPPAWHQRLERLWETTWPHAEYLGLIDGGPDE